MAGKLEKRGGYRPKTADGLRRMSEAATKYFADPKKSWIVSRKSWSKGA